MFTGLIQAMGEVITNTPLNEGRRLIINVPFTALSIGESIAVNGVCLTVVSFNEEGDVAFDVSVETLRITALSQLIPYQKVNLERALSASERLGGHYVSGHVDSTAVVRERRPCGEYVEIIVGGFAQDASPYLIPKGSITLDGVSLTINAVEATGEISLMLIPHTLVATTWQKLEIGHLLNVEFDYLTRIVAHQLRLAGHFKSEV